MNVGLLVRRERWTLSWKGRLLALAFASVLGVGLLHGAYPFLAVSDPVGGHFIVLEGWTANHPGVLKDCAAEFKRGDYRQLLIVQQSYGEDESDDESLHPYKDPSDILANYGVPRSAISYLLYPAVQRDRTYQTAVATKNWFALNNTSAASFDVATLGPHARRSRLTFRQVFGNRAKIGVVALRDRLYDPTHWWQSSEGLKEVQSEAVAYLYACVHFLWL